MNSVPRVFAILVFSLICSCKSAHKKQCEQYLNKVPLKLNAFQDVIDYNKNDKREVDLIIIDGRIANRDLVVNVLANSSVFEIHSIISNEGSSLDGPSKRTLIIISNHYCKKN